MGTSMCDLAPILVTSPVPRSGTTLVQRLLCSSKNTLIFGENAANELQTGVNLAAYKRLIMGRATGYDAQLQAVLEGDVDGWISDLLPPMEGWIHTLESALLAPAFACRDYAAANSRPLWGAKLAGWPPQTLQTFLNLLPNCKIVYVVRDLPGALSSAKGVDLVQGYAAAQQFANTWKSGVDFAAQNADNERFFAISYDALLANPEPALQRLADFTGATSMSTSTLAHRFNTTVGDPRLLPGQTCLAPVQLSPKELQLVANV